MISSRNVAVIITAYNRPEMLRESLELLLAYERPLAQVIVRDNSPESSHVCQDLPVTYIWDGRNLGVAGALNDVLPLVASELILVLDDDTLLPEDALEKMLAQTSDADVVTIPTPGYRCPPGLFPWSPTVFRRSVFDRYGLPMSELFFTLDDWEFGHRINKLGGEVRHVAVNLPRHVAGRTWPGRAYFGARNATFLLSRRIVWSWPMFAFFARLVRSAAVSPSAELRGACRRGIWAGLRGRVNEAPEYLPLQADRP